MRFFAKAGTRLARADDHRQHIAFSDPGLTPWLAVERFDYERLDDQFAVVRLLTNLNGKLGAPAGAMLVVQNGELERAHPASAWDVCGRVRTVRTDSPGVLSWRASFAVPLDVVEYPGALFTLTAVGRVAIALPAPQAELLDNERAGGLRVGRIRRHAVSLAAGFAIAAITGSGVGVGAAGAITSDTDATTTAITLPAESSTDQQTTTDPGTTTTPSSTTTTPSTTTTTPSTTTTTQASTTTTPSTTTATPSATTTTPVETPAPAVSPSAPSPVDQPSPTTAPDHTSQSEPTRRKHHQASSHGPKGATGGAALKPRPASPGTRAAPATPVAGAATPNVTTTPVTSVLSSPWNFGLDPNPFTGAEFSGLSSLLSTGNQPPMFLVAIYKAAGKRYHVPWKILAAINAIETDYGRNLNVSSAGAIGWMQFMPDTWHRYAVAEDGRGRPNPYNPADAILTAARYLAANGARHDLRRAIFAYNHANWYVDAVMLKAQAIVDRRTSLRHAKGYALPLAPQYMHQLGRTDDGVDIETAPDGALVYSMTPGIVTAVADDPGGFGPNYPVIVATEGPLAGKAIYYGHVALSIARVGDHVSAGQPIAVMGHTGDAAGLGRGHIEIGFSNAAGDPLDHHGAEAATAAGSAMRRLLVGLSALNGIGNS